MKSSLIAFVLFAASLLGLSANAQFNLRPNPGHNIGSEDLCNAEYIGTWYFREGRYMSISVQRGWRNQVTVVVSQDHGSETLRGECHYGPRGSARLSFGGGANHGDLRINRRGLATGMVSGYEFEGEIGGSDDDHNPNPRPGPGPRPDFSVCAGSINGTWGFRGGRPMTLTIQQNWRDQVTVLVQQRNGAEQLTGYCRPNFDGSAVVEFGGGANSGNVTIYPGGQVSGIVSGFSFSGFKN